MNNSLMPILDRVLVKQGFKRKSATWFVDKSEAIVVVNLQKSQWGEQYYVNLAVWVKALGETRLPPKEHLCHVRTRLTSLADDLLAQALDLTNEELSETEREQIVETQLLAAAVPFLTECGTVEGLARLYQAGKLGKAMVHRDLKQLMSKVTRLN
jgi:hypothetical protein